MRFLPRLTAFIATLGTAAGLTLLAGTTAVAPTSDAQSCPDWQLIFARGSGQTVGADEAERFRTQFTAALGDNNVAYTELDYPAVPINKSVTPSFTGQVTATPATAFADSVATGVSRLTATADQMLASCPDTKFVLAGYSQGAMVVLEAITAWATAHPAATAAVALVTSFGDPTLVLPEGEAAAGVAPTACRGEGFSPWRAWVPTCTTHTGLIRSRNEYVPPVFSDRTHTWCAPGDVVCGGSQNLLDWAAHRTYAEPGGPIDEAAHVAAYQLLGSPPQTETWWVRFPIDTYYGKPGEVFRFAVQAAANLLPISGATYDIAGTATPRPATATGIQHVFTEQPTAGVQFTGPTPDSGTAHAQASVVLADAPAALGRPTPAREVTTTTSDNNQTAHLTWTSEASDAAWVVWVNHYPVGLVVGRTDATVNDLPPEAVIAVSQVGSDGSYSTPVQAAYDRPQPGL